MTRNEKGEMGTWWGRKYPSPASPEHVASAPEIPPNAVDYRNAGVPSNDSVWFYGGGPPENIPPGSEDVQVDVTIGDVNDRGRGRTVETQSGGVAVLGAYLEWRVGHVR